MFKKTIGTQKKDNKVRYNRKPEDKDIHLNVVGVPQNNVRVNKTPLVDRDEDYHLYKISIDTTKKDMMRGKKRHVGPSQQPKPPSKLQQIESPQSSLKSYFKSNDGIHPNVNQSKVISPSKSRDHGEDNNSDVCFTHPEEETRNVRIVGQPLQKSGLVSLDSESNDRSLKPKQVGFADVDTVYGSASSVESSSDFPYRNSSPEVYQMQNKSTEDPFLTDPMKVNVFPEWTPAIGGDDNISKHTIPEAAAVKYNTQPHSNTVPYPSGTVKGSTSNIYKSSESFKSSNAQPVMSLIKTLPSNESEQTLGASALISNISRTENSKPQNKKNVPEPPNTGLWRGKPLFEGSIGSFSLNVIASKDHNISPSKHSTLQSVKSNNHPVSGQDAQQRGNSTDIYVESTNSSVDVSPRGAEYPDSMERITTPKSSKPLSVTPTTQAFSVQGSPLSTRPSEVLVPPLTTVNIPQDYSTSENPENLVSMGRYTSPVPSTVQAASLPPELFNSQDLVNRKSPVEILSTPTRTGTTRFLDSSTSPRDSERTVPGKQYSAPSNAQSASRPFSTQELPRRSNDRTTKALDPLTNLNVSSQKDLKDHPVPEQNIPQKTSNAKDGVSNGQYSYKMPLKNQKEGVNSHVGISTATSMTDEDSRNTPNQVTSQYNSLNISNSPKETFSTKRDHLRLEETPNYILTLNPTEEPQTRSNTTGVTVRQSHLSDVPNKKSLLRAKTTDREIMTEKVADVSKARIPKTRSKLSRRPSVIQKKSSKDSDKSKTSSNKTKPSIKQISVVSSIPKPMRLKQNQKIKQGKRDDQTDVSQTKPLNSEQIDYPVWSGLIDSNQSHFSNQETKSNRSDFSKKEAPNIASSYQKSRPENEDKESVHRFQANKYLPTGLSNDPSIEISSKTYGEETSGKGVEIFTNIQTPKYGTYDDDKLEEFLDKLGNRSRQQMGSIHFTNASPVFNQSTLMYAKPSHKDSGKSEIEVGTATKEPSEPPQNNYYDKVLSINDQDVSKEFETSNQNENFSKKSLASGRSIRSGDKKQKGETFLRSAPFIETIEEEETPDEQEQYPRGQRTRFPEINTTRLQNVPSKTRYDGYQGEIPLVNDEDSNYETGHNPLNKNEILAYPGRVDGQTPFAFDSPGESEQNDKLSTQKTRSLSSPLEQTQPDFPRLVSEKMVTKPQISTTDQYFRNNNTRGQREVESKYVDNRQNYLDRYSPEITEGFQDKWSNVSNNAVSSKKDGQLDKNVEPMETQKRKRQDKGLERQYRKTENAGINNELESKQIDSLSHEHNIFGLGPEEQMIYVGRVPNTTYNVFFSPETPDVERSSTAQEEAHKRKSTKRSRLPSEKKSSKFQFATPKGMIIFVNKKQDSNYDPFKEATSSIRKTLKRESGEKYSYLPKSSHSSGKNRKRTAPSTIGPNNFPSQLSGENEHYSKDTTDSLEQHMGISPGFAQAGGDKKVMVERSPSGNKITQRYPCGCLRIITRDGDNELQSEELISAFCREGSKCEVSHPELQKYNRVIQLRQSTKKDVLIPEIEVIADGIISRKPIEPKPPVPTMRGANFTGSLHIKSNRFNGVCNFYFDPRLKQYLRNNIDEFKAFLEDDESEKHS
ncbi:hypothetical protein J6590_069813 [Homalodisca vitripennis]|nr:hypothetical protein J6590_069813 [Homalodisca vitripennis]